jgi:hypothetical protein
VGLILITSIFFNFFFLEAVSGLKINLAMSVLVPVGDVVNMDIWLAFWVAEFPLYL